MAQECITLSMKKIFRFLIVSIVLLTAIGVVVYIKYSINQGDVGRSDAVRSDSLPQSYDAQVVGLTDGDTIKVLYQGKKDTIKLFGIDAPEIWQFYGLESTIYLQRILCNPVTVETRTTDRYGRTVAVLWCDGIDINKQMVEAGYAWAYRRYSEDYVLSENQARSIGIGLWQEENPMPPWIYRRK